MSSSSLYIPPFYINYVQHVRIIQSEDVRAFYVDKNANQVRDIGDWQDDYQFLPKGLRNAKTFYTLGLDPTDGFPTLFSIATRCLAIISKALVREAWWLPCDSDNRHSEWYS